MKRAIVGFHVGFHVGKSGQPDKPQPHVINDLRPFCRKCRVPTTGEKPEEFESLPTRGRT